MGARRPACGGRLARLVDGPEPLHRLSGGRGLHVARSRGSARLAANAVRRSTTPIGFDDCAAGCGRLAAKGRKPTRPDRRPHDQIRRWIDAVVELGRHRPARRGSGDYANGRCVYPRALHGDLQQVGGLRLRFRHSVPQSSSQFRSGRGNSRRHAASPFSGRDGDRGTDVRTSGWRGGTATGCHDHVLLAFPER